MIRESTKSVFRKRQKRNYLKWKKLWELGSQAIEELLGEDNVLLEKLSVLESNMADLNFKERMEKKLEEEN